MPKTFDPPMNVANHVMKRWAAEELLRAMLITIQGGDGNFVLTRLIAQA